MNLAVDLDRASKIAARAQRARIFERIPRRLFGATPHLLRGARLSGNAGLARYRQRKQREIRLTLLGGEYPLLLLAQAEGLTRVHRTSSPFVTDPGDDLAFD